MLQLLLVCLLVLGGVCTTEVVSTTIHREDPESVTLGTTAAVTPMPSAIDGRNLSILSPSERKKRLLPYQNFYFNQPFNRPHQAGVSAQQYHDYAKASDKRPAGISYQIGQKFTPFLENNALPGPFRPIVGNPQRRPEPQHYQYVVLEPPTPQEEKPPPDLSAIYEKLAQLKLRQQAMTQKPSYGYRLVPHHRFKEPPFRPPPPPDEASNYQIQQPSKTTVEMFTATNIDIPDRYESSDRYRSYPNPAKTEAKQPSFALQAGLPLTFDPAPPKTSYMVLQQRGKVPSPTFALRKPQKTVVEESYVAEKLVPIARPRRPYRPVYITQESVYDDGAYHQHRQENDNYPATAVPPHQNNEASKGTSLANILKKLQDSNALPQTLTEDNIDNSIKTLVRILNALKDRQKVMHELQQHRRPAANPPHHHYQQQQQQQQQQEEYGEDNEAGVDLGGADLIDTPDGGTPGKAGVDYPALSSIPKTTFSCKTQRYKGFFGDPDTNCQVWHYCDLNGGQASFLCPNGTIFSQVALTCDWWYNVKCASTAQLYVLNERLYKYIIPLSPKFPEDYSGPLVDKYLAMKFQEMEEKLKKQKKGRVKSEEDDDDDDDDEAEGDKEGEENEEEDVDETSVKSVEDRVDAEPDLPTTTEVGSDTEATATEANDNRE